MLAIPTLFLWQRRRRRRGGGPAITKAAAAAAAAAAATTVTSASGLDLLLHNNLLPKQFCLFVLNINK